MLFHNRYTISIGQLTVLMDSGNYRLASRTKIPIPRFWLKKAYLKLMQEVAESINKTGLQQEVEGGVIRAKLFNKAYNLYPALVNLVSISWDKKHLELIKEITGLELKKLEDRESLISEMKRLQDKYKELIKTEKSEGVAFAQIVVSTEIILEMNIDRNIKLYEFQYYMKAATEKIKQIERHNLK